MSNQKFTAELLRAHGLRKTPIRTEMLTLFMKHNAALSASDIIHRQVEVGPRPGYRVSCPEFV